MKDIMDLHTHTTASGHAYNTLYEMARSASEKGLTLFGSTDHAPKMPGTCHEFYFINFKVIPRTLFGVKILMGSELNILDYTGRIDLREGILERLDYTIASIHEPCYKCGTVAENTNAYLGAIKNPYVKIIGHPDDGRYEIDYPALVQGAREYGKVLELNNHSLEPSCFRQGAKENDTEMLKLCMKYQVPVVMSSDAHFDSAINEFESARSLLEELDFPEELVLNRSAEALKPFVNRKF